MTHNDIKILPDGTRVYSNYTRYKPKPASERKYQRRKPDVEGAIFYGGKWFVPLELVPLEQRELPETRPDTDAYDHMVKGRKCTCGPCQRPEAVRWQDKWRRDRGLL